MPQRGDRCRREETDAAADSWPQPPVAGDSSPGLEQLTSGLGMSLRLLGGCAKEARAWEGGPLPAHGWVQVVCCGSGLTALRLSLPEGSQGPQDPTQRAVHAAAGV